MKVKVCGITRLEQLQRLQDIEVDFAGLIFYPKSKRFVGDQLADFKSEIKNLQIQRVGVFVNESIDRIEELVGDYGLDYVQLHGDEDVHFCKEVEAFVPVIKAIRIGEDTDILSLLDDYKDACTYFLFDTDSKGYGGTGKRFDWQILKDVTIRKPFFLSGGIGPEDADEILAFSHPELYAVDVNSRFETEPGIKDLNSVETFINALSKSEYKNN